MRKVTNAINIDTGELLYIKGHALATYMSDGRTVEEAISNINIPEQDLSVYATKEYVDDAIGNIEITDIPSLDGYAKIEDIPSLDGYVKTEDIPSLEGYAKIEDIPSLDGYAKTEDIPSLDGYATKIWVRNENYIKETDINKIDYNVIQNTPIQDDSSDEFNIIDTNGNVGFKVTADAVYAKDFVTGTISLSSLISRIVELEDKVLELQNTIQNLSTNN